MKEAALAPVEQFFLASLAVPNAIDGDPLPDRRQIP
jgi:hypothetical protein